ncbi:MAG: protocatechuate 3,4-dioxygenase [Pigmentiphaga sp.]|uniref:DODA-type extradiol aromatic ring-opening family dioxygenase n=1 Tax=Pigmentiphaga sp. TaxID=1977564 RepID=UPI0029BE7587|nr:protocatechuate 3,4-dioxygenase [Pigmentiphaga sp.]MDX3904946.1 protocatechuate 3,4-dioxygenase [Pigmentiphaga sp.]
MAEIVCALACSHGPLLATPPEMWDLRAGADRQNPRHWYRGRQMDYASLLAERAPGFQQEASLAQRERRYAACQRALDEMARRFREARADVAIILGNDQREVFREDLTAAFTVYAGEQIPNIPLSEEQVRRLPPGVAIAEEGHCPPGGAVYPGARDTAESLVSALVGGGFDVAVSYRLPGGADRQHGIPHAFGFIYRRIMEDAPPPSVPLFTNVGVPPNRPLTRRCLQVGHALTKAIDALPADLRVAVIASGGFTHFVVDEELDRRILDAMGDGDEAALAAVPESYFEGNTCEIKSWYPLVALMNDLGRRMELIDYVPCYRTEAGTGSGMAFASWQ